MNILKLIESCEVEWRELGEVFDLKNGYTPSKSNPEYWENGVVDWFRMEDIRENGRMLNSAFQKISLNAVKGGKLFPANSIIIATSATIGEHALITIPFLANQRFTNLALKSSFKDKLDVNFVYYYCFKLCEWCKNNTTMSSFASVDMVGFKKFPFPIPPLPVQQEIVRILDSYTQSVEQLILQLQKELVLRQKEYNFYRDKLLSFDNFSQLNPSLSLSLSLCRQWFGKLWGRLQVTPRFGLEPISSIHKTMWVWIIYYKTVWVKRILIMFQQKEVLPNIHQMTF